MADIIHGSTARPKPELTGAFTQFDPDDLAFIAGSIFPGRRSTKKEGTITYPTRADMARLTATERKAGAVFGRDVVRSDSMTYTCLNYGHEQPLADEDRAEYATAFDAELVKAKTARSRILLEREVRVKNSIFGSTWTGGGATLYTDVSAAPWDNAASDAIGHVAAAADTVLTNSGYYPNVMIIGHATLTNLLANTAIQGRFKVAQPLTRDMIIQSLAAVLGLERVLVGDAVYNTADEGLSWSGGFVWPDDYAMICRVSTGADTMEPCIGRTIYWSEMGAGGVEVTSYREEATKSDIIRAQAYMVEKVYDSAFGHLLKVDA